MKTKQSILALIVLVLAMLACQTPSLQSQQPTRCGFAGSTGCAH